MEGTGVDTLTGKKIEFLECESIQTLKSEVIENEHEGIDDRCITINGSDNGSEFEVDSFTSISPRQSIQSSLNLTVSSLKSIDEIEVNDNKSRIDVEDKKIEKFRRIDKIISRAQYFIYSLLGITGALVVMVVWYVSKLEDHPPILEPYPTETKASTSNQSCSVWEITGDGYCDDDANIPSCGYDFQDCCQMENDRSMCLNCTCFLSQHKRERFQDENCQNWIELGHLGDGLCDLNYNTAEYFFDIGDCCGADPTCTNKDVDFGKAQHDFEIKHCPDNLCIKSNNFCITEELGDGICQDHNNGPFCDYDMGDCCLPSDNSQGECCACICRQDKLLHLLSIHM